MKRILPLLPLFALAAQAATTPRGLVVDDLTLSPGGQWRQGALLVRAEVRNPTASDQRVRIRYGNARSAYASGLTEASSDLVVPAGGRSLCEFALPHVRHGGAPRLVAIDGSGRETVVTERAADFRDWARDYAPALYVSRSLSAERLRDQLSKTAESLKAKGGFGGGSSYGGSSFDPTAARAGDFAEPWPGDWRAYSVFSAVFVAERDLPDLPAPAKAALRDYAAAGGAVFLVGAERVPAEFAGAALASLASPAAGNPALVSVPSAVPPDASADRPPLDALRCGLGLVAAVPETVAQTGGVADLPEDLGAFLLRHVLRASSVLDGQNEVVDHLAGAASGAAAGQLGRPPVGVFLLLLTAFAVLAGPVSLWILARKNRRIHILWVLPAVSAAFSVAILLSLLLREGVTPTVDARCGVLLDQRAGRAVVLAGHAFYSPLTLGPVDLPADAAVEPGANRGGGTLRAGRTARYEGWIAPRTPGAFSSAAVRATPLRLEVREDPATGAVEAVNAFGAPIDELYLLDGSGALRTASGLAPGATVPLAAARPGDDGRFQAHLSGLRTALSYGSVPLKLDVLSRPDLASRRFYVAVLPASPFESNPLPGRKSKKNERTIVYGVY